MGTGITAGREGFVVRMTNSGFRTPFKMEQHRQSDLVRSSRSWDLLTLQWHGTRNPAVAPGCRGIGSIARRRVVQVLRGVRSAAGSRGAVIQVVGHLPRIARAGVVREVLLRGLHVMLLCTLPVGIVAWDCHAQARGSALESHRPWVMRRDHSRGDIGVRCGCG
jgi:hypothetical protein